MKLITEYLTNYQSVEAYQIGRLAALFSNHGTVDISGEFPSLVIEDKKWTIIFGQPTKYKCPLAPISIPDVLTLSLLTGNSNRQLLLSILKLFDVISVSSCNLKTTFALKSTNEISDVSLVVTNVESKKGVSNGVL